MAKEIDPLDHPMINALSRAAEWEPPPTAVTMHRPGAMLLEVTFDSLSQTHLTVTREGITIRDTFGPLSWSRYLPRHSIEHVAAEVFTLANWDHHLAIHTKRKTVRAGWGMEEKTAHDLAEAMREVLGL